MQHLSQEQSERFRAGRLSGVELLAVDEHIAGCEECQVRLGRDRARARLALTFETGHLTENHLTANHLTAEHLTFEQLRDYVGGRRDGGTAAGDRAQVERHIEDCDSCRAELHDLRDFAASLPARRVKSFHRYVLAGAIAAGIVVAAALLWFHQPAPALAISLKDGGSVIGLDRQGSFSGPASYSSPDRDALAAVLRQRSLVLRLDENVKSKPSVLLGAGDGRVSFHLLGPVGESVLSEKPEFRWEATAGARTYKVEVFDQDYNAVASSPDVTGTSSPVLSWTPEKAFERGRVYAWQVTANLGGARLRAPQPPDPEARFAVVPGAAAASITQAKNIVPPSHLLLAGRLAQAGLCRDALAEVNALAADNPRSPVVEGIRTQLTGQCGSGGPKP